MGEAGSHTPAARHARGPAGADTARDQSLLAKDLCHGPPLPARPCRVAGRGGLSMRSVLMMVALLLQADGAAAQGAIRQERLDLGRRVAETWCSNCHLVGPGARGPAGDAAPP